MSCMVNMEKLLTDLGEIIAVDTVNYGDEESAATPFGTGVAKGYDWVMAKGQEYGFTSENIQGYAVELNMGQGEEAVGMIAHVDVVPAGDGWETNPFEAIVKAGKVYGRGTVDDKGPLVCCLHAAKYIKDNNLLPEGKKIRLIVGGDEELAWRCMTYYNAHRKAPKISFAADGMFPLVYGEKGIVDFDLKKRYEVSPAEIRLVLLEGGVARNSVPSSSKFVLETSGDANSLADELLAAAKAADAEAAVAAENNVVTCEVSGKSAHAMFPDRGINAVSKAVKILGALEERLDLADFVERYNTYIGEDCFGGLYGGACEDEESGRLTFCVGKVSYSAGDMHIAAGIRYPISKRYDDMARNLKTLAAKTDMVLEIVDHLAPICFRRGDEVVMKLEEAYRKVTGDTENDPFCVGAASYARCLDNTVAFGPIFPGQEEMSHQPNEFIRIEDLQQTTEIYIEALLNLL